MNFLDECRALIAVESTWAQGTRAAADFVGARCAEAGLDVAFVHPPGAPHQATVVARFGRDVPAPELMLQTRLDTAPPGHFARWTRTNANPFNASIYGDVLFGLGAADAKLDFLCKLRAAREFKDRALRLPFVLVGTFGGRDVMAGAIDLIRRRRVRPVFALVGGPTDLQLATAGVGTVTIEVAVPFSESERAYRRDHDVRESSSSQSRVFNAGPGEHAIKMLFEYLANLPSQIAILDLNGGDDPRGTPAQATLEFDVVAGFDDPILPKLARARAALATPAFNLGSVRTGDAHVCLTGAYRLSAGAADADYPAWMDALREVARATGATVGVKAYRGGFDSDPRHEFVEGAQDILREMGLDSSLTTQAVPSEANVFSRLGIPCAAWGPGRGVDRARPADESVAIGDLTLATEFYRRMIERFCV